MVRPGSCVGPAGVSPVLVGTGSPGSRPQFVGEIWRAERGVESTGNASEEFRRLDRYVGWRLKRLLIKRRGRNLRAGQAARWSESWFHDQGLHKLLGTVRCPKAA